jgi:hypothetical protein
VLASPGRKGREGVGIPSGCSLAAKGPAKTWDSAYEEETAAAAASPSRCHEGEELVAGRG